MTDFRMLDKLQELRRELFNVDGWSSDSPIRRAYDLCNEVIDLDAKLHRESLGLEAPPDELEVSA